MRICVVLEHRFEQTPDGTVWTQSAFPYSFWLRYLEIFDSVQVIARVKAISAPTANSQRSDGKGVTFAQIPHYIGPWQYLQKSLAVQKAVETAISLEDAILLRVPSNLAHCLEPWLYSTNHPYGLEVVGDPYDVFSPGAFSHPLRFFFRWWYTHRIKQQCLNASAISYVTRYSLQKRYPASLNSYSTYNSDVLLTHYSSVELSDQVFAGNGRSPSKHNHPFTLITVASLEHLYKAPEVLINAIAHCLKDGLNLQLVIVGDGKHRPELEAQARKLGIQDHIIFRGQLPAGKAVFEALDEADLFVLPSRQEGLPRAMLEAMSRGLPCIGSTIGGIPELLHDEDMVPPGDMHALATKIKAVLNNPERMQQMSERNLETAQEYREEILRDRRIHFYRHLRDLTETWVNKNTQPRILTSSKL